MITVQGDDSAMRRCWFVCFHLLVFKLRPNSLYVSSNYILIPTLGSFLRYMLVDIPFIEYLGI